MTGLDDIEHFMLYIQWGCKTDDDFIRLAAFLGRFNISLIPVKVDELDYFLVKRQVSVFLITKSISQWVQFQKSRKRHLDFFLSTSKVRLFHLNSFKEENDYLLYKQKGNYVNVSLPLSLKEIIRVVLCRYVNVERDNKWPGGRRSRLPQIGRDS